MVEPRIVNVFFQQKPAQMLIALKNSKNELYASNLAKDINCTYSHVVKILKEMQKAGLVEFNRQGRLKLLNLTKKGNEVADKIISLKNILMD